MVRKLPQPISKEDFDKVLEEMKNVRDSYWKPRLKLFSPRGEVMQDYVIAICLAFGAGLRISEIFGLEKEQNYRKKIKDDGYIDTKIKSFIKPLSPSDIDGTYIRIKGAKGRKDRTVPLPIKLFRKAGITKKQFLDKLPLRPQQYSACQKNITRIGEKILKKHITFHMLRHGYASFLLKKGVDLPTIQLLMGHSRLDTTGIYLHVNPEEASKQVGEIEW